jgi:hypothetical protein
MSIDTLRFFQTIREIDIIGGNKMNNFTMSNLPTFTGRNVPIKEIAQATGKDPQYIRIGLQKGIFHFGYAFKKDGSSEYNYLCPDKKVWEDLGYFREESENSDE